MPTSQYPLIRDRIFWLGPGDKTSTFWVPTCPVCRGFAIVQKFDGEITYDGRCNHFRGVFIDGSCLGNGGPGATAGVGIVLGREPILQQALVVDKSLEIDDYVLRTSQRAELLAAIRGLEDLSSAFGYYTRLGTKNNRNWVICSDSQYVIRGMTEWLPKWRRNGWVTNSGNRPVNLDLFLHLDEKIIEQEEKGINVGFRKVTRETNSVADELAKKAARSVEAKPTFPSGMIHSTGAAILKPY